MPIDLVDLYGELVDGDRGRLTGVNTTTAAVAAFAMLAALSILDSPDARSAGARLRGMVTVPHAGSTSITATHFGRGKTVSSALRAAQISALVTYLGPSDQLRYRSDTDFPRDPPELTERHRHVPGLLWPRATVHFTESDTVTEELAAALSCALMVVGARITLAQAARLLGSLTTESSISRVLQRLSTADDWPRIRAALIRLADTVDAGACPIDYARRRALAYPELLAGDEWYEICSDTAVPAGPAMRLDLVRCWMYEQMTGSPAHRCPTADRTREFRLKLTELDKSMTPNLLARLDRSATQFLERHGCGAEPLRWHPCDKSLSAEPPASSPQQDSPM